MSVIAKVKGHKSFLPCFTWLLLSEDWMAGMDRVIQFGFIG